MTDDQPITQCSVAINIKYHQNTRYVGLALRKQRQRLPSIRGQQDEDKDIYEFILYAFMDSPQYSHLETVFAQHAPNECFVSPEILKSNKPADKGNKTLLAEYKKLRHILENHEITIKAAESQGWFRDPDVQNDLMRLLDEETKRQRAQNLIQSLEDKHELAMGAMSCLIKAQELMSRPKEFGNYVVTSHDLSSVMQLDSSAMYALNLLPDSRNGQQPRQFGSVFQVLNRGQTVMGKRVLERWIRMPLIDAKEIETRLDMVEYFMSNSAMRSELLEECMKPLPDLDKLAMLLSTRPEKTKLADLVLIYDAVKEVLPRLCQCMNNSEELLSEYSAELNKIQAHFTTFIDLVEEVVDLDSRPTLIVNSKHDEELTRLRAAWDQIQHDIELTHQEVRRTIGGDIKCDKDKVRGYVFRVVDKKEEARLSKLPQIHICQVLQNGVHFTTPELKSLAKDFKSVQNEYEERQKDLIRSAVEVAATYVPVLEAMSRVVAKIDVLLGFAATAAYAGEGYCRPQINTSSRTTRIVRARHPCVELQDGMNFIPNGYDFEQETSRFQIITGPNTAGKSTYIKEFGVLAAMAQIGSFVPAEEALLPIFDRILARIGAGDFQQQGVSTFMAEMLEASVILDKATENSLVIVDELGRGTSTFDGYGLAYAISRHLIQEKRALCLFATHFHELTTLENEQPGVVNKHVTAHTNDGRITMVYEIQEGPCLESFGINVAELTQFPESVITTAKRKASELEHFEKTLSSSSTAEKGLAHLQLQAFTELPLDQLADNVVVTRVRKLLKTAVSA